MYNMDAKVVELSDKTHQLVVLSGLISSGFSNIIQGYNFERDYVQNVVDIGDGGLNFAGRPALVGDPMIRNGFVLNRPSGESDFSRSLIVVGGSERSCFIRGTTSAIDSVLFSVQGSTLTIGMPYETQTLNINLSNTGHMKGFNPFGTAIVCNYCCPVLRRPFGRTTQNSKRELFPMSFPPLLKRIWQIRGQVKRNT